MKFCPFCSSLLKEAEFYVIKNRRGLKGLSSYCKTCTKQVSAGKVPTILAVNIPVSEPHISLASRLLPKYRKILSRAKPLAYVYEIPTDTYWRYPNNTESLTLTDIMEDLSANGFSMKHMRYIT